VYLKYIFKSVGTFKTLKGKNLLLGSH